MVYVLSVSFVDRGILVSARPHRICVGGERSVKGLIQGNCDPDLRPPVPLLRFGGWGVGLHLKIKHPKRWPCFPMATGGLGQRQRVSRLLAAFQLCAMAPWKLDVGAQADPCKVTCRSLLHEAPAPLRPASFCKTRVGCAANLP